MCPTPTPGRGPSVAKKVELPARRRRCERWIGRTDHGALKALFETSQAGIPLKFLVHEDLDGDNSQLGDKKLAHRRRRVRP